MRYTKRRYLKPKIQSYGQKIIAEKQDSSSPVTLLLREGLYRLRKAGNLLYRPKM